MFLYVCFHFGPHIGFLDLSESFLGTYVSNFLMGSLYSAFSVTRWQYQMWILSCKVMWLAARVQYPFTISKSLSSSLASYHSSISFCSWHMAVMSRWSCTMSKLSPGSSFTMSSSVTQWAVSSVAISSHFILVQHVSSDVVLAFHISHFSTILCQEDLPSLYLGIVHFLGKQLGQSLMVCKDLELSSP